MQIKFYENLVVLCININELNWILELMTCRVQNEALLGLQRRKMQRRKKKLKKIISGGFWLYAKVEQCSKLRAIQNLNGT